MLVLKKGIHYEGIASFYIDNRQPWATPLGFKLIDTERNSAPNPSQDTDSSNVPPSNREKQAQSTPNTVNEGEIPHQLSFRAELSYLFTLFVLLGSIVYSGSYQFSVLLGLNPGTSVDQYASPPGRVLLFVIMAIIFSVCVRIIQNH